MLMRTMGLLTLLMCTGVAAADRPSDADTATIIGRSLTASPLAEDLRQLTDEVGGRVSGTPAMARAVDWALDAFRTAGVAAHTENYTMP